MPQRTQIPRLQSQVCGRKKVNEKSHLKVQSYLTIILLWNRSQYLLPELAPFVATEASDSTHSQNLTTSKDCPVCQELKYVKQTNNDVLLGSLFQCAWITSGSHYIFSCLSLLGGGCGYASPGFAIPDCYT